MFEGTLRENIDPVGEHQDVDIWAALEHVRNLFYYTLYTGSHSFPPLGSSQVVRGKFSRRTRCARSRGRVVVVSWTTTIVVFCTGAVEKGEQTAF